MATTDQVRNWYPEDILEHRRPSGHGGRPGLPIADYIEFGDCWQWTGYIDEKGYGRVGYEGLRHKAHRLVFERLVGLIPPGLELDHLCGNRACVNPDHLEPVTHQQNTRRSSNYSRDGRCRQGHLLGERTGEPGRRCWTCWNQRRRERRAAGGNH